MTLLQQIKQCDSWPSYMEAWHQLGEKGRNVLLPTIVPPFPFAPNKPTKRTKERERQQKRTTRKIIKHIQALKRLQLFLILNVLYPIKYAPHWQCIVLQYESFFKKPFINRQDTERFVIQKIKLLKQFESHLRHNAWVMAQRLAFATCKRLYRQHILKPFVNKPIVQDLLTMEVYKHKLYYQLPMRTQKLKACTEWVTHAALKEGERFRLYLQEDIKESDTWVFHHDNATFYPSHYFFLWVQPLDASREQTDALHRYMQFSYELIHSIDPRAFAEKEYIQTCYQQLQHQKDMLQEVGQAIQKCLCTFLKRKALRYLQRVCSNYHDRVEHFLYHPRPHDFLHPCIRDTCVYLLWKCESAIASSPAFFTFVDALKSHYRFCYRPSSLIIQADEPITIDDEFTLPFSHFQRYFAAESFLLSFEKRSQLSYSLVLHFIESQFFDLLARWAHQHPDEVWRYDDLKASFPRKAFVEKLLNHHTAIQSAYLTNLLKRYHQQNTSLHVVTMVSQWYYIAASLNLLQAPLSRVITLPPFHMLPLHQSLLPKPLKDFVRTFHLIGVTRKGIHQDHQPALMHFLKEIHATLCVASNVDETPRYPLVDDLFPLLSISYTSKVTLLTLYALFFLYYQRHLTSFSLLTLPKKTPMSLNYAFFIYANRAMSN